MPFDLGGSAHRGRLVRARPASGTFTGPMPANERGAVQSLGGGGGGGGGGGNIGGKKDRRKVKFDIVRRRGAFTYYFKTVLCCDAAQSALYYCKLDGYGALAPPARLIPLRQVVDCTVDLQRPHRFEIKVWVLHFEQFSQRKRNRFYTFRFAASSPKQAAEWAAAINGAAAVMRDKLKEAAGGEDGGIGFRGPRSEAEQQLLFSVDAPADHQADVETSDEAQQGGSMKAPPPSLQHLTPPPPPPRETASAPALLAVPGSASPYRASPHRASPHRASPYRATADQDPGDSDEPPPRPVKPSYYSPETYNPQPMMFRGHHQQIMASAQQRQQQQQPKIQTPALAPTQRPTPATPATPAPVQTAAATARASPPPLLPRKESLLGPHTLRHQAARQQPSPPVKPREAHAMAAAPPPPRPTTRPAQKLVDMEVEHKNDPDEAPPPPQRQQQTKVQQQMKQQQHQTKQQQQRQTPPRPSTRPAPIAQQQVKLPWRVATSPSGAPYWYNDQGETTWTQPAAPPPPVRRC